MLTQVFLTSLLTGACIACLVLGMYRRSGIIELPFLLAAVILGWVVPQVYALIGAKELPHGALDKTIIMTSLCFLSAWYGYGESILKRRVSGPAISDFLYSRVFLDLYATSLVLLGSYFFLKMGNLAPTVIEVNGGQWTGIITIFAMLSSVMIFGLAISLCLRVSSPTLLGNLTILYSSAFVLHRIIVQGRREDASDAVLMVLLYLFFKRRWLPPRMLQICIIAVGVLFVSTIGQYRSIMLDTSGGLSWSGASLSKISEIDLGKSIFVNENVKPTRLEMYNAALIIEASDRTATFDVGLSYWNGFVLRFVPGQFIGRDLKQAIMFDLDDVAYLEFGHRSFIGLTSTGIAEVFRSFWFFGAIVFFIVAKVVRRWLDRALSGDVVAQVVSMIIIPGSLVAVTHNTYGFFMNFVMLGIFVFPAFYLSRKPQRLKRTRFGFNA